MKRKQSILSVLSALVLSLSLIFGCLSGAAAEASEVTVKNYSQLLDAVRGSASRIVIAKNYKHGAKERSTMVVEAGRTITITSYDPEESALIDGTVDIAGEGTILFERVNIVGSVGGDGLAVYGSAAVTACDVTGGSAKKGSAASAIQAGERANVTAQRAVGGASKNGLGGDAVVAEQWAKVKVGEAVGGASTSGYGGSAVVASGNAEVVVNGSATGGDGALGAGTAVLRRGGASAMVSGAQTDGSLLKDAAEPVINSYAALQYALRSGQHDITLSPKFKYGETDIGSLLPLFAPDDEPITIHGGAAGKKPITFDGPIWITDGTFVIDGVSVAHKLTFEAVRCTGGSLTLNGKVTGAKWYTAVRVSTGSVSITGDVASNDSCAAYAADGGSLRIMGSVKGAGAQSILVGSFRGASLSVEGNVQQTDNVSQALACAENATLNITGDVSGKYKTAASVNSGSTLTIGGSVKQGKVIARGEGSTATVAGEAEDGVTALDGGTVTVGKIVNASERLMPPDEVLKSAGYSDEVIELVRNSLISMIEQNGGSIEDAAEAILNPQGSMVSPLYSGIASGQVDQKVAELLEDLIALRETGLKSPLIAKRVAAMDPKADAEFAALTPGGAHLYRQNGGIGLKAANGTVVIEANPTYTIVDFYNGDETLQLYSEDYSECSDLFTFQGVNTGEKTLRIEDELRQALAAAPGDVTLSPFSDGSVCLYQQNGGLGLKLTDGTILTEAEPRYTEFNIYEDSSQLCIYLSSGGDEYSAQYDLNGSCVGVSSDDSEQEPESIYSILHKLLQEYGGYGSVDGPDDEQVIVLKNDDWSEYRLFRADGSPVNDQVYAFLEASDDSKLICAALSENEYGFIDFNVSPVLSGYEDARAFGCGLAAVKDPATHFWGFIDETGTYVIAPQKQFQFASGSFRYGYMSVGIQDQDGRSYHGSGLIDTKGIPVSADNWSHIRVEAPGILYAEISVEKQGTWSFHTCYLDMEGNILFVDEWIPQS